MVTFKNGTSPGTTNMAFGTQGKEEKPFAVSVKMTAVSSITTGKEAWVWAFQLVSCGKPL